MLGSIGKVFGGLGRSSSETSSTSTQTQQGTQTRNPWEQQAPHLTNLWNQAADAVGWRQGQGVNENTQAGWDQMLGFAQGGGQDIFNTAQGAFNFLGSADQLDPASNPFLQANLDAVTRQVRQNLGQGLNQINQQAVGAGGFGGSRQGVAQGQAITQANQIAADTAAQMLMQNYQQGQQNMASAAQMAPMLMELGLMPGIIAGQVGQEQTEWANPWEDLLRYGQLVQAGNWGGTTEVDSTTTTTGTQQQTNQASPLGMFGNFASGWNNIFG